MSEDTEYINHLTNEIKYMQQKINSYREFVDMILAYDKASYTQPRDWETIVNVARQLNGKY